MRPQTPTYWLLDSRTGWRTGWPYNDRPSQDCQVSELVPASVGAAGIRLPASKQGALSLTSADGSLGGLVMPQGFAIDNDALVYLLDQQTLQVKRFNPSSKTFDVILGIGGEGENARQFGAGTHALAIAGHDLYIVDPANQRVQVFSLASLALRFVWQKAALTDDDKLWSPSDVSANGNMAVILDQAQGVVYRHLSGASDLQKVIVDPDACGRWSRVAIDNHKRIYLLDAEQGQLQIYQILEEGGSLYLGSVNDIALILDRFPSPALRLDHRSRFCLAPSLTQACARSIPDVSAEDYPLGSCQSGGLLFDCSGQPLALPEEPEPLGSALYQSKATWISEALDSQRYNCQWHRLEFTLSQLPSGARVVLRTYADNEQRRIEDVVQIPDHLWESHTVLVGSAQASYQPSCQSSACESDTLVKSGPGQYMWVRIDLSGDGYSSPQVTQLRAHYPRASYLQYLPAVFANDDEARIFAEGFLALFQTEWEAIEQHAQEFARYLDPAAVPDSGWADYLAQWLALPMEGRWTLQQKRNLLKAAPECYEARGTQASLKRYLQAYIENITGLDSDGQRGFPAIIEAYRKRNYLIFNAQNPARIDRQQTLWSPSIVGRLQLDVQAKADEVRLVSSGDPELDVFQSHAHRFQVFVPSSWLGSKDDERCLRRAIEAEKPAHSAYDLCLVEPRLRVGVQSTVGIDTIIGAIPSARLHDDSEELPPSRPPRHRLGYDTVLAGNPSQGGGVPLNFGVRIGSNTLLS